MQSNSQLKQTGADNIAAPLRNQALFVVPKILRRTSHTPNTDSITAVIAETIAAVGRGSPPVGTGTEL